MKRLVVIILLALTLTACGVSGQDSVEQIESTSDNVGSDSSIDDFKINTDTSGLIPSKYHLLMDTLLKKSSEYATVYDTGNKTIITSLDGWVSGIITKDEKDGYFMNVTSDGTIYVMILKKGEKEYYKSYNETKAHVAGIDAKEIYDSMDIYGTVELDGETYYIVSCTVDGSKSVDENNMVTVKLYLTNYFIFDENDKIAFIADNLRGRDELIKTTNNFGLSSYLPKTENIYKDISIKEMRQKLLDISSYLKDLN